MTVYMIYLKAKVDFAMIKKCSTMFLLDSRNDLATKVSVRQDYIYIAVPFYEDRGCCAV